jgi:hypothetical protein
MPDQASPVKPARSQIADAIRAKREGHGNRLIQEDLDKLEASLLAEIDNFDPEAAARRISADELKIPAGRLSSDIDLAFPDIDANASREPTQEGAPAANATPPDLQQPASKGGLLDQLRNQAETVQNRLNAEHQQLSLREAEMDAALRQVFSYLHELAQQLNVLKPAIRRSYPISDSLELSGLVWQHGFSDYRTRPESAGAMIEFVSLNYRLCGEKSLEIERDGTVAENFRKLLFDRNLTVETEEFRNERRYLERARFIIAPEVKVNIRWEADPVTGKLVILTRNLERLGAARYQLPPESLNQALLDEFGRLILNQQQQFARLVNR